MAYKLNIFTGQLDLVNESGGGGGSYTPGNPSDWNPAPTNVSGALDQLADRTYDKNYVVESFTLLSGDIINKNITLGSSPTTPTKTRLIIVDGGVEQGYSVDFEVTGSILSWDGLGFESLAEAGDKILVVYSE